jgi:LPS sulfotransferase NodH
LSSPLHSIHSEQPEDNPASFVHAPIVERNEHLDRLEQHFGPVVRQPGIYPASVSFVFLCFTNRSGSNYLAELLASGGAYNRASEMLNWPAVLEISKRRKHERFQEFFAGLARRRQKSGCFIIKAALQHLDILTRAGVLDQVAGRSQFVMIERNDVLAQAISFAIAFATGAFSSAAEGSARPQDIAYSRETIDRHIQAIAQSRQQFSLFFGRNGIVPVRMLYERLIADPEGEACWLARELGLKDFSIDRSKVLLERQSGPVNDEWRRRYLSERQ